MSIGNEHSPLGHSLVSHGCFTSISSASQPTEKKGKSQASPLSVMCLLHLHCYLDGHGTSGCKTKGKDAGCY